MGEIAVMFQAQDVDEPNVQSPPLAKEQEQRNSIPVDIRDDAELFEAYRDNDIKRYDTLLDDKKRILRKVTSAEWASFGSEVEHEIAQEEERDIDGGYDYE